MISDTNQLPDKVLDEQRRQWLDGREPDAEQLLRESGHSPDSDALLDLLYNEIVVREELGQKPSFDEYRERFPELAEVLHLHFEVHQAVHEQLSQSDSSTDENWPWPQGNHSVDNSATAYVIRRLIGQGGMAVVYQAQHRQLRRDVAMKMFRPGRLLTSHDVVRIRIEAESMARLAHPNIIQIFEIGENEGIPFLALELATGGTLAERLQHSPMSADVAAELLETLARTVQYAHDRKVIHRDLKPANILFARDGTPKITDFGLAKVLEGRDEDSVSVTRTSETLGTPRYMAPEQANGQNALIGPQTDVYALGTILYECLTGRAPFVSASVPETLQMIRDADPLPPRRLQPSVPRDLETICLHCLEKEPARRYSTSQELSDDLKRFRRREPIRIRPVSAIEKTYKWCRKKPAHATLIALTTTLFMSALIAFFVTVHQEKARMAKLRDDVVQLMKSGRVALDADDLTAAQSRFQEAWQIVQGEPKLSEHETSVTGWLDHSRNALNRSQWKQRIPPRDFDQRRDEALLLSLLQIPQLKDQIGAARNAIREALELTIPKRNDWVREREQLILLDVEMLKRQAGAEAALALLDSTQEFDSKLFHLKRSEILANLNRQSEADVARAAAERHPLQTLTARFHAGVNRIRDGHYAEALAEFDWIMLQEPEHFTARLLQALCFLKRDRPSEAIVALTACVAQRPHFQWSFFFRGLARRACGETELANQDFQFALEGRPSDFVKQASLIELGSYQRRHSQSSLVVYQVAFNDNSFFTGPGNNELSVEANFHFPFVTQIVR